MGARDRDIAGLSPEKRAVLEWYLLKEKHDPKRPVSPLLVPIQTCGSQPPIFWLHSLGGGGGGGLFAYWALAQLLGPDQPSFGIAGPAEPLTRIELMAAHSIEIMRTVQPRGPYRLGGYCFGGVVAFEMACQLARRKLPVGFVALLESHLPCSLPQPSRLSLGFLRQLGLNLPPYLHELSKQRWTTMAGRLQRKALYWTKKAADPFRRFSGRSNSLASADLLESIIDMSRYPERHRHIAQVHFDAYLRYVPQAYPGRVFLFRTRKPVLFSWNPEVLWNRVARGGVGLSLLPGTHENILEYPHVQVLATKLKQLLQQPEAHAPAS